jgi:hypothetical protein
MAEHKKPEVKETPKAKVVDKLNPANFTDNVEWAQAKATK